jgi:bifunctional DNA-binding transcriptional regulator/antitoxin component of YhaV-PrlF toxin-antitoxin module
MNDSTYRVPVTRRGTITLPRELREHNHIETGDTLTLGDLGNGVVVMSRQHTPVDVIANQLAKEWRESGETLESMLRTLRKVRAKHGSP